MQTALTLSYLLYCFSEVILFRIERTNDVRALLRKCAIAITTPQKETKNVPSSKKIPLLSLGDTPCNRWELSRAPKSRPASILDEVPHPSIKQ